MANFPLLSNQNPRGDLKQGQQYKHIPHGEVCLNLRRDDTVDNQDYDNWD